MRTLEIINASGGQAPLIAVEIRSPVWEEPLCLVQAFGDMTLTDSLGESFTFRRSAMQVSFPERNTGGFSDLTFTVAGVSGEALERAESLSRSSAPAALYLLEYLPGADEPCWSLRLSVTRVECGLRSAAVTAGWHDTLNRRFPYHRYTARRFPGLKYV